MLPIVKFWVTFIFSDDRQYVQYETDELSGNYSDDEAEIETLDGRSESELGSRCCYMSPIYNYAPPKHFSPTRSVSSKMCCAFSNDLSISLFPIKILHNLPIFS